VLGLAPFDVGGFPSTSDQVGVAENAQTRRQAKAHRQTLQPAQTSGAQPKSAATTNLTIVAPGGIEPDGCCD
jgi:hypothetical protein